jgi:hypothetical protein
MGGMPMPVQDGPKQLEALQKQAEAAGLGKGMPGGMPGLPGGMPGGMKLPGARGGLPGLAGPAEEEVRGMPMTTDMTTWNGQSQQARDLSRLDRQYRRGARAHARRALPLHQGGEAC